MMKGFLDDREEGRQETQRKRLHQGRAHLGAPFCEELEVALEVRGEDEFDQQEAEAAQLRRVQVTQPEELGPRTQQTPGACSVVVLEHRAIVVQDCLRSVQFSSVRSPSSSTQ